MRKMVALLLCFALICCLLPAFAESISMTGNVVLIEKYGHAELDIAVEDFDAAGFALGDIVTVTAGGYEADVPYLNGYYVDRGEGLVRACPGDSNIAVCINYQSFAEVAGIDVGDPVTLTLKGKAGALTLQEVNNLVYTNDRADYASDEVFANFRPVVEGRLYRSASPINNKYNRAATADRLIRDAGVRTVMDMASTDADIAGFIAAADFDSPHYKALYEAGNVIALGLPVDFASDSFAEGIVKGFTFLSEHEPPYDVHCVEGKDRTGFAIMMLEMLIGFDTDAIVADYMTTYGNYYGVEVGSEAYDMIAGNNVMDMMRMVAGLESDAALDGVDWKAAGEQYLLSHGMSAEALARLMTNLT